LDAKTARISITAALDLDAVGVGYVLYMSAFTLRQKQVEDGVGGVVAEELAQRFLVIGDVVLLDQLDEVARGVERERGFGEVRVLREEAAGLAVDVGEVAAAASGDEDLAAGQATVVEQGYAAAALAGNGGAHEACGSGSEDDGVELAWWRHGFGYEKQIPFGE
jgi:hypothetical protein